MSRIKWALVKSRLQYQFAEWPDTWPVKLSARHLARLQAVHVRMDGRVWSDEIKALQAAIDDATNAGELPCTIETFKFQYEAYSYPISASPAQQAQARKDACYQKDLAAISAVDFEHWLTTQGELPSIHIAAWVQSTTLTVDTAAPAPETVKPVQRSAAQDAAILKHITTLGHSPLAVPKNTTGKAGVKFDVRNALKKNLLFVGVSVFDRAWERLTRNGEIVIQK